MISLRGSVRLSALCLPDAPTILTLARLRHPPSILIAPFSEGRFGLHVLVIGGTHFLGKSVIQTLLNHGHGVSSINLDPEAQRSLPAGVESIHCNRKDHEALKSTLAGRRFDAVADIVYAPTRPEDVAAVMDALGRDFQRYVFTSSATVYRKTGVYPITEDHPKDPKINYGPYTRDKLDCESFLFQEFRSRGTPVCVLRPSKIYGPENYSYREGFHFDRLANRRPIVIPGNGTQLIQFGYVDDVANAFRLAIERGEAVGEAFTVNGPQSQTLETYIDMLMSITGVQTRKVFFDPKLLDRFEEPGLFFGEPARWGEGHDCYDISKARDLIGFRPQVSIEDGMRRSFEWFQETGGASYRTRALNWTFEDELIQMAEEKA